MQRNLLYRIIHARLKSAGMQDMKEQLAWTFSDGQSGSLKDLTQAQLTDLADHITAEHVRKLKPMRAKVVAILCKTDPERFTIEDAPNYEAINGWCRNRTAAKKPLLSQDYTELVATVSTADAYQRAIQLQNKLKQ